MKLKKRASIEIPRSEEGYADAQFEDDIEKSKEPLGLLAEKARRALAEGTSRPFPR